MEPVKELIAWIGKENMPSTNGVPCKTDTFKNNICHCVKSIGDVNFLIAIYTTRLIDEYWKAKNYYESLYLLGMTDYLSRLHNISLSENYAEIRTCSFKQPIFPNSLILKSRIMKDETILKNAIDNAIPEFKRFNIIENEVKDCE